MLHKLNFFLSHPSTQPPNLHLMFSQFSPFWEVGGSQQLHVSNCSKQKPEVNFDSNLSDTSTVNSLTITVHSIFKVHPQPFSQDGLSHQPSHDRVPELPQ